MEKVVELPKKLIVIVSKSKVLLPGFMLNIIIPDLQMKSVLQSKFKKYTQAVIGIADSTDVNTIGTAGSIVKITSDSVLLTGLCRFRIEKLISTEPHFIVKIAQIENHDDCKGLFNNPDIKELYYKIQTQLSSFLGMMSTSSFYSDSYTKISPCLFAELCCIIANFNFDEQLKILNSLEIAERLKLALEILNTKKKMSGNYNTPKLSLKSRLNLNGLQDSEFNKLTDRIKQIEFLPNIKSVIHNELKELTMMTPMNPQYNILFSHLSLIADLPWNVEAEETLDLRKTKQDLDVDHYGLEKVKTRILEYLAVRKLRSNSEKSFQGPILCLVGPPGVGKTSIARSIAATLNRPFERVSLGGVNNMSDIRGHRKAYIGSMPGRIIQAIKRSGVKNPVILLDEIDKMTCGNNGDPAAALLEVLDPSQNKEFLDHYLNIPFDLSQILFIATANKVYKLSAALYDRLEIIHVTGYTYLEKLQIAMKYLLPKQLKESGLNLNQILVPEETVQLLIHNYTHEAGVRNLERKIGAVCRSVAFKIASESDDSIQYPFNIDKNSVKVILGPEIIENNKWISRLGKPGVAVGLVVSDVGGDTIAVESSLMPGSGKLILTGSLGKVMKESAQLAWGWVRANAQMYGIQLDGTKLNSMDLHIHFPEGAVSKDGPSAGVTVAATIMSLLLERPLISSIAMTGEITLQGLVLGVGAIKAKVLAAHKDQFTKIIIPQENAKHLHDIPACIKDELTIILVSDMHEIIETIFEDGETLIAPEFIKSKI